MLFNETFLTFSTYKKTETQSNIFYSLFNFKQMKKEFISKNQLAVLLSGFVGSVFMQVLSQTIPKLRKTDRETGEKLSYGIVLNNRDLQVQLEGTENRINVERKRYNDAVSVINKKVRFFPNNIIAAMFGFEKRTFFEAVEGAEEAPEVEFA